VVDLVLGDGGREHLKRKGEREGQKERRV